MQLLIHAGIKVKCFQIPTTKNFFQLSMTILNTLKETIPD